MAVCMLLDVTPDQVGRESNKLRKGYAYSLPSDRMFSVPSPVLRTIELTTHVIAPIFLTFLRHCTSSIIRTRRSVRRTWFDNVAQQH